MEFRVTAREIGSINADLFGQFLERASWGEPGPEAFADPETGRLPENVVETLESMRIPVVRFPGGSDVDRIDWTDMIDNVPGREGGRPVTRTPGGEITNRFGYDEYFELRDRLGWWTIIVCNLIDALTADGDPEEAIIHAAGLVAYCNAPMGAALPDGMRDWPAVRARNGRHEPFGADYIQIGNEIFFKQEEVRKATALSEPRELAEWYIRVMRRYIEVVRAIDPDVKIIIDAAYGKGPAHEKSLDELILSDDAIRSEATAVTLHRYAPGLVGPVRRPLGPARAEDVEPEQLTIDDWWYATSTMPAQIGPDGTTIALTGESYDLATELGYRIACTEWNWNGWGMADAPEEFRNDWLPMAKALGAAGFLHGLMRQSEHVDLATQSMLLGHRWDITAVRADPEGKRPPYFLPQGKATTFYNLNHGSRLLDVEVAAVPMVPQRYIIGRWTRWPDEAPEVAVVEVLASADDAYVHLHVIQRHAREELALHIDVSDLGIGTTAARHRSMTGSRTSARAPNGYRIQTTDVEVEDGVLRLPLPPRTLHVIQIRLPGR